MCLVGIMIWHIQPICDFPLVKDIPATIYENNIEGRIQSNEIGQSIFHQKYFFARDLQQNGEVAV